MGSSGYRLHRFSDCDELLEHYRSMTLSHPGWFFGEEDGGLPFEPPSVDEPYHLITQARQRLGISLDDVEESDMAKTDGRYIYSMTTSSLVISRIRFGGPAELASALNFSVPEDRAANKVAIRNELLLHDQTVIAIRGWEYFGGEGDLYRNGTVQVIEVDVSDPFNPTIANELTLFDAQFLSAWLDSGSLRMALWHYAPVAKLRSSSGMKQEGKADPAAAAREHNGLVLEQLDLRSWQPIAELVEFGQDIASTGIAVDCEDTYSYSPANAPQWTPHATYIVGMDLTHGIQRWSSTMLLSDLHNVYATYDAIYLTLSDNWGKRTAYVHRFDARGDSSFNYLGSVRLEDSLLPLQALNEHGGYLRVAINRYDSVTNIETWTVAAFDVAQKIAMDDSGHPMVFLGDAGLSEENQQVRDIQFIGDTAYVTVYHWNADGSAEVLLHVLASSGDGGMSYIGRANVSEMSVRRYVDEDPLLDAWRRYGVIEAEGSLVVSVGYQSSRQSVMPTMVPVHLIDVADPSHPRVIDSYGLSGVHSLVQYDERAGFVSGDVVWLPVGMRCGESTEGQFVGLWFDESGFVRERTITLLGCPYEPPGVRPLAVGEQLHLISGEEIKSLDLAGGDELGVLDLSMP